MDWARLDLRMSGDVSVSDADRETIRQVAEEAIIKSEHDPEVVLKAAADSLSRAGIVANLRAYATRSIFRALKRETVAQAKKEGIAAAGLERNLDFAGNDSIDNAILLREVLDTLAPQDREIFVRKMEGETFPEIDSSMSLKPRTAEWRFRSCSASIRQAIKREV